MTEPADEEKRLGALSQSGRDRRDGNAIVQVVL